MGRLRLRRLTRLAGGRQHPPLHLGSRRLGLGRGEQAAFDVAIDLGELGSVNEQVGLRAGRSGPGAAAKQGRRHQQRREQAQRRNRKP